jgi:hypothetical protein
VVFGVFASELGGCSDSTAPVEGERFRFRESIASTVVRFAITSPTGLAEAENLLQSGEERWMLGTIRRGDGAVNTGFNWHLDPATISFAEVTIEACQTAASAIADDLDYWIGFGQVCIWGVVEARGS